jgi:membrane fusion protein (multidrug efflux system)
MSKQLCANTQAASAFFRLSRGWATRLLTLGLVLTATSGCDDQSTRAAASTPQPVSAAVAVTVQTLVRQEIPVSSVLPGRTAPFRVAEVRPQVGGVLRERLFNEGEAVRAGQPLFQIDPAPFEAAVRRAEAALARIEAAERLALSTANRLRSLARSQVVSEQNLENAEATLRQAQADILSTRAALETARIDLRYIGDALAVGITRRQLAAAIKPGPM